MNSQLLVFGETLVQVAAAFAIFLVLVAIIAATVS
jgi:hypothetical protein